MAKLFARKKIVACAMAGMLAATAFNPTGCTITVDEQFLQSVLDQVNNVDWEFGFRPEGHDPFGLPPCPGDDCDGDWEDSPGEED